MGAGVWGTQVQARGELSVRRAGLWFVEVGLFIYGFPGLSPSFIMNNFHTYIELDSMCPEPTIHPRSHKQAPVLSPVCLTQTHSEARVYKWPAVIASFPGFFGDPLLRVYCPVHPSLMG